MAIDWKPFVEFVDRHQQFLLTTHVRPDPDGLGSMLALADILESRGKTVQMLIASVWPPRYNFMDLTKRIQRFNLPGDAWQNAEAVVILDTGTWNQLGDFGTFLKTLQAEKVVIDHHQSQDDLGAVRFVDTDSEATGRLVYEAAQAMAAPVSENTANHMFAALATDTGWFRHNNTTPRTFALAEQLMQAGANPTRLYEEIYEQNSPERMKLIGLVLQRMQVVNDGRVAYTELRLSDYESTRALPHDSEDLINYPRSIAGVEVGLFFMEQPAGGVKISFRSQPGVDVAKIAEQFGGGGHQLASGAIVHRPLPDAIQEVLQAVSKALPPLAD